MHRCPTGSLLTTQHKLAHSWAAVLMEDPTPSSVYPNGVIHSFITVHWSYVLASSAVWTAIYLLSSYIFRSFSTYQNLPRKLQLQWDTRIVAFLHAIVILTLATYGLTCDQALMDDHKFGYSTLGYTTMAIAVGYFLWDMAICIVHFKEFGVGFFLHGVGCFFTFFFSLVRMARPSPLSAQKFYLSLSRFIIKISQF